MYIDIDLKDIQNYGDIRISVGKSRYSDCLLAHPCRLTRYDKYGNATVIYDDLSSDVAENCGKLLTDLNHLTWSQISAIGRGGRAHQQIALGAVKTDHMKDGYNAKYRVIGFDHDDLADGSGKAPFTWEMVRVYKDNRPINEECTNKGGWDTSDVRKWLNSEFLGLCSDELQSVIRPVIKLSSAGDCSREIIKSVDRIFILSEKEVFGRAIYSFPGEGRWYEYYKQEDISYVASDLEGNKKWKWERSSFSDAANTFCVVYANGTAYSEFASRPHGLAMALCT